MGRKPDGRKIAYGTAAVVLFLCLFFFTFRGREPEERQRFQMVFFGDSTYGNVRDETSVPEQVGRLLGKTVYNAAFGGTSASRRTGEYRLDYSGDSLSLAALTKAVYAEDFGVQQTIRLSDNAMSYFAGTVDELESIDFSGVETVLIGYGLNDYFIGVPLDVEEDGGNERCFAGALRKSVETLRRANSDVRIVLLTPTYNWLTDDRHMTCEEYDAGGGVLEVYVEKELALAEELGVEVIDLYHDFFPHERWEDWELYTLDGIHPNEAGRAMMAEKIAGYLEGEEK